MDYLSWAVVGVVLAPVFRWIMPGHDSLGLVGTICLAVFGALVGAFAVKLLDPLETGAFDTRCLLAAIASSAIVMFAYRAYSVSDQH